MRPPIALHLATRSPPASSVASSLRRRATRDLRATAASASAPPASSMLRFGPATFASASARSRPHEAARAYDAVGWRLGRPRPQMNFQDVWTCEQAQAVAPPPRIITDADRHEHRRRQRRLLIAEADKRAMAEWRQRHPEDVANEHAFWAEKRARQRAERADRRRRKALAIS
nr:uncharacterized protein LOC109755982 [Aegilops tauschii subsp. strangulata]